jgi:hypothetical protein
VNTVAANMMAESIKKTTERINNESSDSTVDRHFHGSPLHQLWPLLAGQVFGGRFSVERITATILDHRFPSVTLAELRCAYQPLLLTPTAAADVALYRKMIERFLRRSKCYLFPPLFLCIIRNKLKLSISFNSTFIPW